MRLRCAFAKCQVSLHGEVAREASVLWQSVNRPVTVCSLFFGEIYAKESCGIRQHYSCTNSKIYTLLHNRTMKMADNTPHSFTNSAICTLLPSRTMKMADNTLHSFTNSAICTLLPSRTMKMADNTLHSFTNSAICTLLPSRTMKMAVSQAKKRSFS